MQDEAREPLAETIERLTGRIMNGIIIAAGILGLAIWSRPASGPHYQIVATTDGRVVRVNTKNGSIVSCDAARCALVYRSGHDLERAVERQSQPKQLPLAPQAAPAPAQRAASPAAPQGR